MESSQHNWANISETICPELLIFGVLDVVLSEYLNKSYNFTNFIFYDVIISVLYKARDMSRGHYAKNRKLLTKMMAGLRKEIGKLMCYKIRNDKNTHLIAWNEILTQ